MNFLPDDVVPDRERDGEKLCRQMLSEISFFIELLSDCGLCEKDLENMFAQHSRWYRRGQLKVHERSMMCAIATLISGSKRLPSPPI